MRDFSGAAFLNASVTTFLDARGWHFSATPLKDCLNSRFQQNYKNWRLLVFRVAFAWLVKDVFYMFAFAGDLFTEKRPHLGSPFWSKIGAMFPSHYFDFSFPGRVRGSNKVEENQRKAIQKSETSNDDGLLHGIPKVWVCSTLFVSVCTLYTNLGASQILKF